MAKTVIRVQYDYNLTMSCNYLSKQCARAINFPCCLEFQINSSMLGGPYNECNDGKEFKILHNSTYTIEVCTELNVLHLVILIKCQYTCRKFAPTITNFRILRKKFCLLQACRRTCLVQKIIEKCSCYPPEHINNVQDSYLNTYKVCTRNDIPCKENVTSHVKAIADCNCVPPCTYVFLV